MRKKAGKFIARTVVWALLCLLFLSLGGCARNETENKINCLDLQYSYYDEVMAEILPSFEASRSNSVFDALRDNYAAVEAFDIQAIPAQEQGVAPFWYPQYLATLVIAADRDKTDAVVTGWGDLPAADEAVGFPNSRREILFSTIAYSLEGENFTLAQASALLAQLNAKNHLFANSFEQPLLICYDNQAAAMIKAGRNIEIIVPREGTITFERGLLSNIELNFAADTESLLISAGFRLTDGRCDSLLYPDEIAYENADSVTDFDYFNSICIDGGSIFRRAVFGSRLFTHADERESLLATLLYMSLAIIWLATAVHRAVRKSARRLILLTGIILLGWIAVHIIKYETLYESTFTRYLWYSYYLFQLALPLVALRLAWGIDKPDDIPVHSAPGWLRALAAASGLLLILIFTNDLHNLVFRFDLNIPNWSYDYTYGIVFWFVQAACYLPLIIAIATMMIKSKHSPRKKGFLFPIVVFAVMALYGYAYIIRVPIAWESDSTLIVCLFTILLFEVVFRVGLIPVNSMYSALFANSPLNMRIVDDAGNTVLSSASAVDYDKDLVADAIETYPTPILQDKNTLLFATKITGGSAVWQEDITGLSRLYDEVQESVQRLSSANAVLAEEEKIERAITSEHEKTQLMSQLEVEIAVHTAKLSGMMEQLDYSSDRSKHMALFTLLLCYVKRRCNLFFRERETRILLADELAVYIEELAEIAAFSGVRIIFTCEIKASLSVRHATLFYDFFHGVADWAANRDCPHMLAHLGSENGSVTMRLLPSVDAREFLPDAALSGAIASAGGDFAVKDLDDAAGLSLTFRGQG